MAAERVEVVRAWVDAFNRRDIDTLLGLSDEHCELRPYLASLIESDSYRGHDGIKTYFRDADIAWDAIQVRLLDNFHDEGSELVGSVEIYGRARSSGLEVNLELAWLTGVEDGKVTHIFARET